MDCILWISAFDGSDISIVHKGGEFPEQSELIKGCEELLQAQII